jgi:hypothetical protein
VAECLHPVGDARVAVGDHDADLAVRIRLGLSAVQRRLVVDVVQRDVPEAAQLETEVRRVAHRQRDHQRLVGSRSNCPTDEYWVASPPGVSRGGTNVLTGIVRGRTTAGTATTS